MLLNTREMSLLLLCLAALLSGCVTNQIETPLDSDDDGVPDSEDVCPGYDDELDADGDGVPDGCDECEGSDDNEDEDNDGQPDGCQDDEDQ